MNGLLGCWVNETVEISTFCRKWELGNMIKDIKKGQVYPCQVPIHGRLFAQWMHHAFPRELLGCDSSIEMAGPHCCAIQVPLSPRVWYHEPTNSWWMDAGAGKHQAGVIRALKRAELANPDFFMVHLIHIIKKHVFEIYYPLVLQDVNLQVPPKVSAFLKSKRVPCAPEHTKGGVGIYTGIYGLDSIGLDRADWLRLDRTR